VGLTFDGDIPSRSMIPDPRLDFTSIGVSVEGGGCGELRGESRDDLLPDVVLPWWVEMRQMWE
jgi:hypothetical protein